jgi:hypothetical protein
VGSENTVAEYLKTKTAGVFGGLREGAVQALSGRTPDAQRLLRGVSPADAMSAAHGFGQQLGRGAAHGAMGAAGALAVGGGVAAAGAIYDAVTKAHDFRSVLEQNPDLAAKHQEDPRLVNRMFSTLRTFNPQFSKDPVVAGSYLRQMVEDPVHAGGKVVETLNFRDKMRPQLGDAVTRAALGGKKK